MWALSGDETRVDCHKYYSESGIQNRSPRGGFVIKTALFPPKLHIIIIAKALVRIQGNAQAQMPTLEETAGRSPRMQLLKTNTAKTGGRGVAHQNRARTP